MTDYSCFKYREIDKRLLELLVQSEMYFPHREQLNDPFDCNIDISRAIDRALTIEECQSTENLLKFQKEEVITRRFSDSVGKMGIGSFSLSNNETLLWSHYANNHKGVVLRYDFPESFLSDEDSILSVSKISYKPNTVSDWIAQNSNLYTDNHKKFFIGLLKKVLASKAPAWEYEQEARIVRHESGMFCIPRTTLTHVLFGLQTSPEDERLVRKIVDGNYDNIRYGRTVRTDDDFGIGTIEI